MEILDSNLGSVVLEVDAGCIGYADDLAIVANSVRNMQWLVSMTFKYSSLWR